MMNIPSLFHKFCSTVWEYDARANEAYFHFDKERDDRKGGRAGIRLRRWRGT